MSEGINNSGVRENGRGFIERLFNGALALVGITLSIPMLLYFLLASICLLLCLLFLSILPAIIHLLFFDYVESNLRFLSRSTRGIFLIVAFIYWGSFLLIGFVRGQLRMKGLLLRAIEANEVTKIHSWRGWDFKTANSDIKAKKNAQDLTVIPFLSDIRDGKDSKGSLFYKKRCLLVLPSQVPTWGAIIISFLTALIFILVVSFSIMKFVANDYWWVIFICDMLFITFSFVLGYQLGKFFFKRKLHSIRHSSVNITGVDVIANCVLYGNWSNPYIFICPYEYLQKFSLEEASEVYHYHYDAVLT